MDDLSTLLQVLWILAIVVVGIVLAVAPVVWIARRILAPIDRAAKFRKAAVRFSIGDFLCLFLAIQIPLAAVHRFIGKRHHGGLLDIHQLSRGSLRRVIWYAVRSDAFEGPGHDERASLCILGPDHAARVLWLGSIYATRAIFFSSACSAIRPRNFAGCCRLVCSVGSVLCQRTFCAVDAATSASDERQSRTDSMKTNSFGPRCSILHPLSLRTALTATCSSTRFG